MKKNLPDNIDTLLDQYFNDLDGDKPTAIYEMVINTVEKPLLLYIMNKTEGNQSKAAKMLGLNRNTLRKKLKQYNLDN
ncbi:Fis family transcriptional regulator [Nitrosomonadales bacterium]|jgi:Fis family transcriptional regulator|nr:Fis family transcriptional regulator [Methylophilaceae bacterium]MDA9600442.1 Fis family transcriptional regulator [Nitrosomonadales bacterium]MDA9093550.1 Fis family transcriptional regulator [Methylophilaceae bacterium]MDC0475560.1 Fis family transcriptional regulator [Methylophilaceae bacterium]MDC6467072.1 helix-turn-helix domain-containing protein [Methylophilaceae bacterium]|tara:strand:- start:307 stop:540 length:234 start_codon:yes stop_codon:yes gene_type:complete